MHSSLFLGPSSRPCIAPVPSAIPNQQPCRRSRAPAPTSTPCSCRAWGRGQPALQQLWDYDGTCVKPTSVEELQLLHRRSFGHRNARTYMVVVYSPTSPACQAVEQQVERLACGSLHEPSLVVAALDTSSSKEAAQFAQRILGVTSLPAVLLYPEAAPGFLRYAGPDYTAEALLAAVNKARQRSMPRALEYELIEAYTPLGLAGLQAQSAVAAAEAQAGSWTAPAHHHHHHHQQQQQQQQGVSPTPLVTGGAGYWSPGKALFWGFVAAFSIFGFCWDRWLSDSWEAWCLQRRQAARQRGKKFTVQENLEDLMQLMMNHKMAEMAAAVAQEEQKAGLGRRAKGMEPWAATVAGAADGGSAATGWQAAASGGGGNGSSGSSGVSASSSGDGGSGSSSSSNGNRKKWEREGPMVPAEWQQLPIDGRTMGQG